MSVLSFITIAVLLQTVSSHEGLFGDDYTRHPCRRVCHLGELPKTCKYTFKIEWYTTISRACYDCPTVLSDCLRPACILGSGKQRPIVTANRMLPGPSIEVCKGDRIRLNIINNMQNGETVTIHFHGAKMRKDPFMDGTPMVSQCPIVPDTSFTMEFLADDVGTHFWHGHVGLQRADGLAGAFIVRDHADEFAPLFDIDNHAPIILQDWYETETASGFFSTHHYGGAVNLPSKALLLNGRYSSNDIADAYSAAIMHRFHLDPTKRHRFRVISNVFMECPLKVTLQGHDLLLINTDGHPIRPQATHSVTIYPGERYDFIPYFTGEYTTPEAVYFLDVVGEGQCATNQATTRAQFAYTQGLNPRPETVSSASMNLAKLTALEVVSNQRRIDLADVTNETLEVDLLESLTHDEKMFSKRPDVRLVVDMDFDMINNDHMWPWDKSKGVTPYTARLNQITFQMPPVPLMSQPDEVPQSMYCNADHRKCGANEFCECIHMVNVSLNSLVELIMIDNDRSRFDALHPMHIHGYSFRILALEKRGQNLRTEDVLQEYKNGTIRLKTKHALVKDTITIPPGGFVIARFIADNPGVWPLHCHIDNHMAMGMQMLINVGSRRDLPAIPPKWPRCGNWALPHAHGVSMLHHANALIILLLPMIAFRVITV